MVFSALETACLKLKNCQMYACRDNVSLPTAEWSRRLFLYIAVINSWQTAIFYNFKSPLNLQDYKTVIVWDI